ncbi:glycosyltransferase [Patescibacteria group bacterium]|nr:glycosyltransferase [Patescibacteria group bacterium]
MASYHPLVSVIILNWNGLEYTKICLEHVRTLDYPNYEVIIVDNGSSIAEKKYLSSLKDIKYIDNKVNRGFTGGQLDGFEVANGEFILLLNNDAVIKSDYLKQSLSLFEDKRVAVVGGRSYFWDDSSPVLDETNQFYSYLEVSVSTGETHLQSQDYNAIQEVNSVSGSAVIVRRSAIDSVGYLYKPFFAYYEETDLFA